MTGSVVGVRTARFLDLHGIEVDFPSSNRQERTSWV